MLDDEEAKRRANENLTNPKNKFLFLFCHAKDVDNSWGCDCSFAAGVIIFSIICGFASILDIYFIASNNFFGQASGHSAFKFFFAIQVISDFFCLIGIGTACYSVNKNNYTFSIVSYYVLFLVLLLHTIYCVYTIVAILDYQYFTIVKYFLISWGIDEFGLILFSWILFCNQVCMGRQRRNNNYSQ